MPEAQARFVRRSTPTTLFASFAAACALLVGGAQAAQAAPDDEAEVQSHTVTASAADSAEQYWSVERMQAAVSADVLALDNEASAEAVETGAPSTVQGTSPATASGSADQQQRAAVAPVSHIGKVFFTLGGSDYVCSGNSVVSGNESTVSTAGHCLNEGPGAYATNWVFAPAYDNGDTPYGVWSATELVATDAWVDEGDINYDTGFAVVSNDSGETLSDTVGASGVAFNQSRGLDYTAYGYPADPPYDGETLQNCTGAAIDDSWGGTQSQGIPCDMTGGSSGGPWFIGSGATGVQNSVNSFGYDTVSDTMFGPYWGSVIETAYESAAS